METKKYFNIDGKEIELSKEQLEDMVRDFDKVWTLKFKNDAISIYKYDEFVNIIAWAYQENNSVNFSTISRTMAACMSDLMETEDVLDEDIKGYYIDYNIEQKRWKVWDGREFTISKHFKTEEKAQIACDLLNNYKGKIFGYQLRSEE